MKKFENHCIVPYFPSLVSQPVEGYIRLGTEWRDSSEDSLRETCWIFNLCIRILSKKLPKYYFIIPCEISKSLISKI